MNKILIVDDDVNVCQLIELYLRKEGFVTAMCHDGRTAVETVRREKFDMVIMDVMMPVMDGFAALRAIRDFSMIPVLMLSARGESMDKITGLDSGADDYVTKPFEPQELILRVRAVLRRMPSLTENSKTLKVDNVVVSVEAYTIKLDGKKIDMTPKEIELFFLLASNPGRVYTRLQLFDEVWGGGHYEESRSVDVHIKRIREKLVGLQNWQIKTVWGVGYKFEEV